jgi:hypothetical protein
LGFDIVPLLASDLDWWALAVELNVRVCALREAELALRHASVRGAALEPLLLEAVDGLDEFQTFQVAHGTSLAMTAYRSGETSVRDAELTLALYKEGLESSLALVGEPTHAGSWWTFTLNAPPAKRRKLLKSTKQPPELLELFEVAWTNPTQVMRWLVDNSDRLQAWSELGSALDASGSSFLGTQSFVGVDLVKAAKVFEQLDFPIPFVEEVLKALVDGGLDDLAVDLEAKLPQGCVIRLYRDWERLGARALVGGAFRFVTALLRPRRPRVVSVRGITTQTRARLIGLGRDAAAAAFGREFSSTLLDDGSEEALEDDGNDEATEEDGSAEAIEGRGLAMKLLECSVLAK